MFHCVTVVFIILAIWIVLPTILEVQYDENLFTMPFRRYIELEYRFLDIVFGDDRG